MIRVIVLVIAAASTIWSLAVWLVGGFRFSVGSAIVTSTDALRPLALAMLAAMIYVLIAGIAQVREDIETVRPHAATALAILLSASPAVAGLARNSWTAGGSDSYAYVAQADLWLQGTQSVAAPIASEMPWPNPLWTLSPYGFKPAANRSAIVPITPPGLSLMMAAAKAFFGHRAMFWVVPVTGALLVWTTFLIGRQLSTDGIGVAAAWLLATSPPFLAMLVSPMSDVPATLFWAVAIYFALKQTRRDDVLSGLATSAAILVRPNLAPLALVLFAARPSIRFIAALMPSFVVVAWFNNSLYGSPLASGYGDLSALFSINHVPQNVRHYATWFVDSQTPLMLGAFVPLAIGRTKWLGVFTAVVVALYIAYVPFEAWWYLRFLLPSWPALCVGAAVFWLHLTLSGRQWARRLGVIPIAIIGVHGIAYAAGNGAFPSGEGDHRYATIGKIVEQVTGPQSVILTGQNAGAIRYYGGRITLRFDSLDRGWLDRAVTWLSDRGHHPYFVLEEWELPIFQERFSRSNRLGALSMTPVFAYQGRGVPGQVYVFDPAQPEGPITRAAVPPAAAAKCVEPAPPVMLNWR